MNLTFFQVIALVVVALNPVEDLTRATAIQLSASYTEVGKTSNFPSGGKVAIIVRGEAFRADFPENHMNVPCSKCAGGKQMQMTKSLIHKLIEPLEKAGNRVEVIVTDVICSQETQMLSHRMASTCPNPGRCPMTSWIVNAFEGRVMDTFYFETSGQADGMRKVLNAFNNRYGGADHIATVFDYVMIVRHDLMWYQSITSTQTDFNKFNFFGKCQPSAPDKMGGVDCVWDTVHIMPANMYTVFNAVVGTGYRPDENNGCFDPMSDPTGCGHPCKQMIEQGIRNISSGAEIGFMTDTVAYVSHITKNEYIGIVNTECDDSLLPSNDLNTLNTYVNVIH